MSEGPDRESKTEEATPQKLERAREKGDGARTMDLGAFATLAASAGVILLAGGWLSRNMAAQLTPFLQHPQDMRLDGNGGVEVFKYALIAAVPALLIALAQSPRQALYVLVLYLVLQSLDGYVFTPLVQRRTVALPPALTIGAQVLLGVLFGGLGVLLATPLAASVLVLVKMLYLHDTLHEQITLPGRSGEQAVQGQMHARERGAAS